MRSRPTSEILTIGDELLKGSVLNRNAQFLGEQLIHLGFDVVAQQSCPDQPLAIQGALQTSIARSDVIILTGGLGPTPDDKTRESLAEFFHVPLEFSKEQYDLILAYFKSRKRKVPKEWRREAEFPANATPLVNRYGIALGFYIHSGQKLIIVLPGVPSEMRKMFTHIVTPLLHKCFPKMHSKYALTARIVGLGESVVMQKLGKGFFCEPFDFGIYPSLGEVVIRLQAEKKKTITIMKKYIEAKLGRYTYAYDETPFAAVLAKNLAAKKVRVAVAESCTGGQLGAELTHIPGASAVFAGGLIAYTNEMKRELVQVREATLKRYGAVSGQVAKQLATGVAQVLHADYGIGITGIAGPDGGSKQKPVGTVFIAVKTPAGVRSKGFVFGGDRPQIQRKSVLKALEMLWSELKK